MNTIVIIFAVIGAFIIINVTYFFTVFIPGGIIKAIGRTIGRLIIMGFIVYYLISAYLKYVGQ